MSNGGDRDFTIQLKLDNADAKRAAAEAVAIMRRQEDAARALARTEEDLAVRGARAKEDAVRRASGIAITEAQRAARVSEDIARRLGRAQEDAARKGRQAALDVGAGIRDGQRAAAGATEATTARMLALNVAMTGLRTGVGFLKEIGSTLGAARLEADRWVDRLLQAKDLLRETAAVKGVEAGADNAFLLQNMRMRMQTGLSAQEQQQFSLEFAGAGAPMAGRLPEGDFERLEVLLGRFAATQGGGAEMAEQQGKLGGLLLGYQEFESAEEVLATQTRMMKILSAGVGSNRQLIHETAEITGTVLADDESKNLYRSPEEVEAVVSTASRTAPKAVSSMFDHVTRTVRGFEQKWAPMLEEAEVTPEMKIPDALLKLFEFLDKKAAEGIDSTRAMEAAGMPAEMARSVTQFYNNRRFLEERLAEAQPGALGIDAQKAVSMLDRKFAGEAGVPLRIKQAEAGVEEQNLFNAMRREKARELKLQAERELGAEGYGPESAAGKSEDYATGLRYGGAFTAEGSEAHGRRIRVERKMAEILKRDRGVEVMGRPAEGLNFWGENPNGNAMAPWWQGDFEENYSDTLDNLELEGRGWRAKVPAPLRVPRPAAGDDDQAMLWGMPGPGEAGWGEGGAAGGGRDELTGLMREAVALLKEGNTDRRGRPGAAGIAMAPGAPPGMGRLRPGGGRPDVVS